jgi:hypothetical protein
MPSKYFQICLLLSLAILSINFLSASDSQLYQSCGGDAQTTIGCIGDSQIFFTGAVIQPSGPPSLTIIKPRNETYIKGNGMKVEIETNSDDKWYNIDNGQNKTINPSNKAVFNADEGVHIIYVFANSSIGLTAKNVTFTVDSSRFSITHSNYEGADRGETTNFSEYSYDELQDLGNVVLEKAGKGRIRFNQNINFSDDSNPEDSNIDFNSHIIISPNRIEINSSALPNFNKSATLFLYDLSFANPQILMDGSVCPDSVCTEGSYSGGTFEFNVTHFTVFSTRETPQAEVTGQASGGGGGKKYDCYTNADCKKPGYGICWDYKCISRLFDVKILGFQSPINLGDFFEFTYSLKDMANVDNDVNINFWIGQEGENITSGSEIVFVGGLKEVEQTGKLFIPEDIESGDYIFYIQVSNYAEIATVHRTIQIIVDKEKGTATIIPVPESPNITLIIIVFSAIVFAILVFFLVLYLKQRARINGMQNILEGIYEPYLKTRLKLKILRNKRKNHLGKRPKPENLQPLEKLVQNKEETAGEKPSDLQPKKARFKNLRDFQSKTAQEILDKTEKKEDLEN